MTPLHKDGVIQTHPIIKTSARSAASALASRDLSLVQNPTLPERCVLAYESV